MSYYHDDDYDGVVLMIPNWFIDINKFDIGKIQEMFESCKLSIMHPDHERNLHELSERLTKREFVESKRRADKQKEDESRLKYHKLLSGEIFKLEWKTFKCPIRNETINMLDGESYEEYEHIRTKTGVKKYFSDLFAAQIKTLEDVKKFSQLNPTAVQLMWAMQGVTEDLFNVSTTYIYGGREQVGISFDRLMIGINWRKNKHGYAYSPQMAAITKDGKWAVNTQFQEKLIEPLGEFERNGMFLYPIK
jgi:hypothetical protein